MIKKELAAYHRVPGSSDQNTDLDMTLVVGWGFHVQSDLDDFEGFPNFHIISPSSSAQFSIILTVLL